MSDDKIVNFPSRLTKLVEEEDQPNPVLIEILKDLLQLAEKSELRAFAFTGIHPSGDVIHGWEGPSHAFHLLAGLSLLHSRLVDCFRDMD